MKKILKENSLLKAFLTSFLYLILVSFVFAVTYEFSFSTPISYLIAYIFFIIYIVKKNKDTLYKNLTDLKKIELNEIIKIITISLLFTLLMIISNKLIINYLGRMASNELENQILFNKAKLQMGLNIIIFGPIVEEMIFRFQYQNVKGNKLITFIFYTIIFAIAHVNLTNPSDYLFIVPYLFLSLSIGYSYYKTDNIFMSIIAHILNNFVTIMILL